MISILTARHRMFWPKCWNRKITHSPAKIANPVFKAVSWVSFSREPMDRKWLWKTLPNRFPFDWHDRWTNDPPFNSKNCMEQHFNITKSVIIIRTKPIRHCSNCLGHSTGFTNDLVRLCRIEFFVDRQLRYLCFLWRQWNSDKPTDWIEIRSALPVAESDHGQQSTSERWIESHGFLASERSSRQWNLYLRDQTDQWVSVRDNRSMRRSCSISRFQLSNELNWIQFELFDQHVRVQMSILARERLPLEFRRMRGKQTDRFSVREVNSIRSFQVGPSTTLESTECLCKHLTSFGSDFYVPPNTIDFKTVFKKFKKLHENAAVFSTVIVIIGLYIIAAIWARRKDKRDLVKVQSFFSMRTFTRRVSFISLSVDSSTVGGQSSHWFVSLLGHCSYRRR